MRMAVGIKPDRSHPPPLGDDLIWQVVCAEVDFFF